MKKWYGSFIRIITDFDCICFPWTLNIFFFFKYKRRFFLSIIKPVLTISLFTSSAPKEKNNNNHITAYNSGQRSCPKTCSVHRNTQKRGNEGLKAYYLAAAGVLGHLVTVQ